MAESILLAVMVRMLENSRWVETGGIEVNED